MASTPPPEASAHELIASQAGHNGLARRVTVLGATGSVGQATLDLVAQARERHGADAYPIEALTAHRNWRGLAQAARTFQPQLAVLADPAEGDALRDALRDTPVSVACGPEAVREAAERPAEWVMAAIVGAAGLAPIVAAAQRGAVIAIANKEALVCAGGAVMDAVERHEARLLPVDSEHNAIFQVMDAARPHTVERLVLTASGGPFRTMSLDAMASVTPQAAVRHPNWSMGAKISVDSATMMNKGLELIEAKHLFGMRPDQLDVLVHPQSVVHSLVAHIDGSVLAQLGAPDMRIPIAHTLAWPDRMATQAPRLDLAAIGSLTFETPDENRFGCLKLAREALAEGDAAATVLNAANEIAVERFLDRRLGFLDISSVVADSLDAAGREIALTSPAQSVDGVLAWDALARRLAYASAQARAV